MQQSTKSSEKGERFLIGSVLTLSVAHFVHDIYTAFLAPLLPLIIESLGLSLALAGTLAVFMQLPSVFNPWFGAVVDKVRLGRWLVILSPSVTAAGMCLIGLAPSYSIAAVILLTVGISVAAIHLAAPPLVAEVAGDRLGRGTSFFMVGGELARTLGPLVAVQAVSSFGLEGLWRLVPLAFASSALLWWRLGRARTSTTTRRPPTGLWPMWKRMRRVIAGVFGVLMARALMTGALVTFLPTMLYGEGSSLWFANIALSAYELAGAAGALTAGTLSDWLGRRKVLVAAIIVSPTLLFLFLQTQGALIFPVILALGFTTLATTPVLLATMLESSGGDRSAASGTFMMMSFAIRALVVPVVGLAGDAIGLRPTFTICAFIALAGIPFALLIPGKTSDRNAGT